MTRIVIECREKMRYKSINSNVDGSGCPKLSGECTQLSHKWGDVDPINLKWCPQILSLLSIFHILIHQNSTICPYQTLLYSHIKKLKKLKTLIYKASDSIQFGTLVYLLVTIERLKSGY